MAFSSYAMTIDIISLFLLSQEFSFNTVSSIYDLNYRGSENKKVEVPGMRGPLLQSQMYNIQLVFQSFLRQMLTKIFYLTLDVLNTHIQFLLSYSLETTYTMSYYSSCHRIIFRKQCWAGKSKRPRFDSLL